MADFVRVEVTTDAQTLADEAIDRLKLIWANWDPNDGDLEVVLIEALAPMAQNAAEVAAIVPAAIFRAYGTALVGIAYADGSPASALTSWTLSDALGHTIPAGTEIAIDDYAFTVDQDRVVAPGATTALAVPVTASVDGTEANALTGGLVQMLSALAWVQGVALDAPTSGGTDAQTDADYEQSLAHVLQLQAETLVTTRDYEIKALEQAGVARAVALHNGDRAVSVTVTGAGGLAVSTTIKNALLATLTDPLRRLVNTTVTILDPTYTTVNVSGTVTIYPGYTTADVAARVNEALAVFLSPSVWGKPTNFIDAAAPGGWINDPVVRRNKLIDYIGNVDGVDYVATLSITGSAGTVNAGGDLTMPGTVALPLSGAFTVTGA